MIDEIPLADSGQVISTIGPFSVWQDDKYLWVQEGQAIQSVMSVAYPAELVLPTHRLMYCAHVLLNESASTSHSILNLGFGVGSLERKLQQVLPQANCTSVDISEELLQIAQQHFFLDKPSNVVISKAEDFVAQSTQHYDLIFIDLFAGGLNAPCLYDRVFYENLLARMHVNSIAAINLIAENETDLLKILMPLRAYLPQVGLAQVAGRKNIVLLAGNRVRHSISQLMEKPDSALNKNELECRTGLTAFTLLPEPLSA